MAWKRLGYEMFASPPDRNPIWESLPYG